MNIVMLPLITSKRALENQSLYHVSPAKRTSRTFKSYPAFRARAALRDTTLGLSFQEGLTRTQDQKTAEHSATPQILYPPSLLPFPSPFCARPKRENPSHPFPPLGPASMPIPHQQKKPLSEVSKMPSSTATTSMQYLRPVAPSKVSVDTYIQAYVHTHPCEATFFYSAPRRSHAVTSHPTSKVKTLSEKTR